MIPPTITRMSPDTDRTCSSRSPYCLLKAAWRVAYPKQVRYYCWSDFDRVRMEHEWAANTYMARAQAFTEALADFTRQRTGSPAHALNDGTPTGD